MPETTLIKVSEHVYWMTPGKPDRPSLGAVVGRNFALMLDAGASAAHARYFLNAISGMGVPSPRYIALTHWHWDHVFGAAEVGVPVIAQRATAEHLARLSTYDWSNAALDQRVKTGEEILSCASDIKLELPEPRDVHITLPDIIFDDRIDLDLGGGVTCAIHHVGGDHAGDSCVMHVMPDRVLFLGDCLYDAIYTRVRHYTTRRAFPLLDTLLNFDAGIFIEGHNPNRMTRPEFEALTRKMRLAGTLVDQMGTDDDSAVLAGLAAQLGQPADEDATYFARAFVAGRGLL